MKNTILYLSLIAAPLFISSCGNEEVAPDEIVSVENQEPSFGEDYEAFITEVDNGQYGVLNSLSYSDAKNNAVQVTVLVDDSSEMVKLEEKYTTELSNSINTNIFYYKNSGTKYASIQYFEEKDKTDSLYFVEVRSYYDTSGNVVFSKKRTAEYEDYLEMEPFVEINKTSCSDDRAMQVLQQEGDYQTTFQGFVRGEEAIIFVVGEPKKEGFSSALVVQNFTPTINRLMNNESAMLGTPVAIQFVLDQGDQLLLDVRIVD